MTATTQNGTTKAAVTPTAPTLELDRIEAERLIVPLIGTSPLIVHRFSEKAKRQMLDNMQGRKSPKVAKDPEREYRDAFYRLEDDTPGLPVIAFKNATVSAANFYGKSVTKVGLRQTMFVQGELGSDGQMLARIIGEAHMREDVVRLGRSGSDLRYRPEFTQWRVMLDVTYVTSALTRSSILSLIDAGGMGVGVGEWRPERNGAFGTYRIDPDRDVEVIS